MALSPQPPIDPATQAAHLTRYDQFIAQYRPGTPRRPVEFRSLEYGLMPQLGLATVADSVVLTGDWHVLFRDRVMMDLFAAPFVPPRPTYVTMMKPTYGVILVEEVQDWPYEGDYLLGGSTNYAHWLLDALPRLVFLPEAPEARILVHEGLRPFQLESLQAAGVALYRLRPMPFPGAFRMKKLRFPSIRSLCGTQPSQPLQPHSVNWLRKTYLPKVSTHAGTRKLFVTRDDQTPERRRLVNTPEIVDAVKRLGFEVVTLDGMPFLDQVQLFANAACIAGPHGAGFANAAFAPATCTVVELMGPRWGQAYQPWMFYTRVSQILSQRYERVVGQAVDDHLTDPLHLATERYTVNVGEVVSRLKTLTG